MQPINLIDISIKTVMETIAGSPILSVVLLLFAGFGVLVIIHHFHAPPRFDPLRHMERPPIDQQPQRPLPPADDFADWATGRQREQQHRGIPWEG